MNHYTHKYLSFAELREKLGGRSRSSIYRDVQQDRLPTPVKIGVRLYWRDDEVELWIDNLRKNNTGL